MLLNIQDVMRLSNDPIDLCSASHGCRGHSFSSVMTTSFGIHNDDPAIYPAMRRRFSSKVDDEDKVTQRHSFGGTPLRPLPATLDLTRKDVECSTDRSAKSQVLLCDATVQLSGENGSLHQSWETYPPLKGGNGP